ncbi:MAG: hypothetical protein C4333_04705 [Meiothermus sp.]
MTSRTPPPEPSRRVLFLRLPEVNLLDLAGPAQVFAASLGANYSPAFCAHRPELVSAQGLAFARLEPLPPVGLPPVERVLVPGAASNLDPEARGQLAARQPGAGITYLHAVPAFAFDPALQDLARQENLPTALFAANRLEYRRRLELSGPGWPPGLLALPLLLGAAGAGCALVLRRRLGRHVGKHPLPGATSP